MSTNYLGALDTLTNPAPLDGLTGHAAQHSNANISFGSVSMGIEKTGDTVTVTRA